MFCLEHAVFEVFSGLTSVDEHFAVEYTSLIFKIQSGGVGVVAQW